MNPDAPAEVIHVFTHFRSLGGVESILRRHLEHDKEQGLSTRIVALFEPAGKLMDRVQGAGLTWRSTISGARKAFRRIGLPKHDPIVVYHNCWGLSFLYDLDGAYRRIGLHHSDWPGVEHVIREQQGLVDGMLCIGNAVLDQVRQELPKLGENRALLLPLPINPPASTRPPRPGKRVPVVIGFCGRVVKAQKRVDRLPEFARQLHASGVEFRLEILGDGPERQGLEHSLTALKSVVFHGRQSGDAYWGILDGWDIIFFSSDYEGLPLALLEAMSRGVIPIYPRIQSGGDSYVSNCHPSLLYKPGDMADAVAKVRSLPLFEGGSWEALESRARGLGQAHAGTRYDRTYADFLRTIARDERISAACARRTRGISDSLPFGLLRRMNPHRWPRRGIV